MIRISRRLFLASILGFLAAAGITDAQTQRIRLMAANTTSGNNQSYLDPGDNMFKGLKPDIVMIQEFQIGSSASTSTAVTDEWVDNVFGTEFSWFREPGNDNIPNGIVSRWPIIASGQWTDEAPDRDNAWARIDIPGPRNLTVVSVHFLTRNSSTRNSEAQDLRDFILAEVPEDDYLVIGGDFNTDSRNESCIGTLSSLVTDSAVPVDQNGNDDTNANRNKPYDRVLEDSELNAMITAVSYGNRSYPNGLVFDSRVYTPLSEVSPIQSGDSGASNMQHMPIVKDFLIPTGGTGTMSPTPTATATGTGPTPTPSPTSPPPGDDAQVFINEIHYDDTGGDDDEGVELAGPAGLDLGEWLLVTYNGNGAGVSETIELDGIFPNQQGCMGTLWFPIPGLQNGSPDGVALVNELGVVTQFLSWEGRFVASGGPADGIESTDIGVEETNDLLEGLALQLTGSGSKASDFTWGGPVAQTRGQVNAGQTLAGCAATPTPSPTPQPSPQPELWQLN